MENVQVVSEPFAGSTTSYFANGTVFVYVAQYGLDWTSYFDGTVFVYVAQYGLDWIAFKPMWSLSNFTRTVIILLLLLVTMYTISPLAPLTRHLRHQHVLLA